MQDFKAQLHKDMELFFNTAEFANIIKIRYNDKHYTLPAIIDYTQARDYKQILDENYVGTYRVDCVVCMALKDLGFVPKKDRAIEIEFAKSVSEYIILKSICEDGMITLELQILDE